MLLPMLFNWSGETVNRKKESEQMSDEVSLEYSMNISNLGKMNLMTIYPVIFQHLRLKLIKYLLLSQNRSLLAHHLLNNIKIVSFIENIFTLPSNLLLTDSIAPVAAPLIIEFQGSSFWRIWTKLQSIVENRPPHTAKLPPITGALCLIADQLPFNLLVKPLFDKIKQI